VPVFDTVQLPEEAAVDYTLGNVQVSGSKRERGLSLPSRIFQRMVRAVIISDIWIAVTVGRNRAIKKENPEKKCVGLPSRKGAPPFPVGGAVCPVAPCIRDYRSVL